MNQDHLFIIVLAALALLGFVAYLTRDRISGLKLSFGKWKGGIDAKPAPGIRVGDIDAKQNVHAVDETGSGVEVQKIRTDGTVDLRNEDSKKV
jgi:hypothetical protein